MALASYASIFLARFDELRTAGDSPQLDSRGTLFRRIAADTRGAATEPASQRAFRFLMLGLHADEASANEAVERGLAGAPPWFAEAAEVWMAVLKPFRHFGECNYLDPSAPGPLFETGEPPQASEPIAIITTAGWKLGDALDMTRVREFSNGVSAVRTSMGGTDGLYSQESFFFPGALQHDAITVTLWRDGAAARAFAYSAGIHKSMLTRQREENLADRTSFTRCGIARAKGTWNGRIPVPVT